MLLVVVDYGVGNVAAIANMLRKAGTTGVVSNQAEEIAKADRLILPGVGAFDSVMEELDASGLRDGIEHAARRRAVPVLGICVGMQMLVEGSAEGNRPGLSWLPGSSHRLSGEENGVPVRVPHMGWNRVRPMREAPLFKGFDETYRFYFAHSYAVAARPEHVLATTRHGAEFTSAVHRDNIYGVQFHPEKSRRFGTKLLANFVEYC